MLAKFLEEHHGKQVGAGKAAQRDVEWRLRDHFALSAGELLAHRWMIFRWCGIT